MNTRPHTDHAADLLRADLRTIRHCWDAVIPKLRAVRTGHGPAGPRTSTPKDDDNGDHNTDVSALDVVLSARGTTLAVLNGWSRVVIEDKPVTTALPRDGHDVHELAEFLDRWAGWLVEHEAASAAIEEIHECAQSIERLLPHGRREWMIIGTCPIVDDETGDTCGGTVRAWPDSEQDRDPTCMRCGVEAVVPWWMSHMLDDPASKPLVTADELISIIVFQLHRTVTHGQIRQWVARGKITKAGRDAKGRSLYEHAAVVEALREKAGA